MSFEEELWQDIPGYEGMYKVSTLGRIHSNLTGKILKQTICNGHYPFVRLFNNGHSKKMYVHRIVAETFISNQDSKPQVNHIDGDKTNNTVKNLEWVTRSENIRHAIATGLNSPNFTDEVRSLKRKPVRRSDGTVFQSMREAADRTGISFSTVYDIVHGRSKTTKCGYTFEFVEKESA